MELLITQFDGLVKGYNDHAPTDKVVLLACILADWRPSRLFLKLIGSTLLIS
jgi:hypothetical protein